MAGGLWGSHPWRPYSVMAVLKTHGTTICRPQRLERGSWRLLRGAVFGRDPLADSIEGGRRRSWATSSPSTNVIGGTNRRASRNNGPIDERAHTVCERARQRCLLFTTVSFQWTLVSGLVRGFAPSGMMLARLLLLSGTMNERHPLQAMSFRSVYASSTVVKCGGTTLHRARFGSIITVKDRVGHSLSGDFTNARLCRPVGGLDAAPLRRLSPALAAENPLDECRGRPDRPAPSETHPPKWAAVRSLWTEPRFTLCHP